MVTVLRELHPDFQNENEKGNNLKLMLFDIVYFN